MFNRVISFRQRKKNVQILGIITTQTCQLFHPFLIAQGLRFFKYPKISEIFKISRSVKIPSDPEQII